jgi:hypothetical protein
VVALRALSITLLVAMLSSCLSYQVFAEKPDRRVQAALAAGQVAFAALVAAPTPKEDDPSTGGLSYPERFGLLVGVTIITDAFVALTALCIEHCFSKSD